MERSYNKNNVHTNVFVPFGSTTRARMVLQLCFDSAFFPCTSDTAFGGVNVSTRGSKGRFSAFLSLLFSLRFLFLSALFSLLFTLCFPPREKRCTLLIREIARLVKGVGLADATIVAAAHVKGNVEHIARVGIAIEYLLATRALAKARLALALGDALRFGHIGWPVARMEAIGDRVARALGRAKSRSAIRAIGAIGIFRAGGTGRRLTVPTALARAVRHRPRHDAANFEIGHRPVGALNGRRDGWSWAALLFLVTGLRSTIVYVTKAGQLPALFARQSAEWNVVATQADFEDVALAHSLDDFVFLIARQQVILAWGNVNPAHGRVATGGDQNVLTATELAAPIRLENRGAKVANAIAVGVKGTVRKDLPANANLGRCRVAAQCIVERNGPQTGASRNDGRVVRAPRQQQQQHGQDQ
jgi:hypothetical protein